MSESKIESFITKMDNDPSLNDKLKQAISAEDVISVVKSEGIEMTKAEVIKAEVGRVLKLSDAELESANLSVSYTTDTYPMGCATWVFGCCP